MKKHLQQLKFIKTLSVKLYFFRAIKYIVKIEGNAFPIDRIRTLRLICSL